MSQENATDKGSCHWSSNGTSGVAADLDVKAIYYGMFWSTHFGRKHVFPGQERCDSITSTYMIEIEYSSSPSSPMV